MIEIFFFLKIFLLTCLNLLKLLVLIRSKETKLNQID